MAELWEDNPDWKPPGKFMPNCVDCKHYLKSGGVSYCGLKVIHVDRVTGEPEYAYATSCRVWRPFAKRFHRCGPSGRNFEPLNLQVKTFSVPYAKKVDKALEIAALLVEKSGFNEEDADKIANEIVAIWVKPEE